MRIGLLTYHHSNNYGALLQAYATAKALKALHHEPVIIDIRQSELHHTGIVGLLANIVNIKRDYDIKKFQDQFYPPKSQRYYSLDDLRSNPPLVDCLLVGSDQVWNPQISKELSMAYFLDFAPETVRRVSYASSFGVSEWSGSKLFTESVKTALSRFSSLSVREETGVKILKETFGKEATLVLDPTMLFKEYTELTGSIPERDEVVCYKLNRTPDFFNNIGAVKKMTGLPARLLNNAYPVGGLRYTYPPSVGEWIRRIAGARYVITDSFHGAVFSILYKRDFIVVKNNNGKDTRLLNLLNVLGLSKRAVECVEAIQHDWSLLNPIDYAYADSKLEELRTASWEYLKSAVKTPEFINSKKV